MWDQRYNEAGFAYGTEPNDFLQAQLNHIPKGGKVLCLAEGEGRNAVYLAKQGFDVTAVDQSSVGLKKAQQFAKENGVTINTVVADLNDFDLGVQQWHGIVSISAHVPVAVRQKLHKKVVDGLKPNGVLIIEAYTQRQLEMEGVGGPPAAQKELFMSLHALKDELARLHFIKGIETERFISEGKYHQGQSAVVQVVAQKR